MTPFLCRRDNLGMSECLFMVLEHGLANEVLLIGYPGWWARGCASFRKNTDARRLS